MRARWLLAMALAVPSVAGAFHDQAANCDSCHVSHNSVDGLPVVPGAGNDYQLLAESPSDVCLLCHGRGSGRVLGLDPLLPPPETGGGNFVFLLEDNLNDAQDGQLDPIPGDAAGHNLVAPGHGLAADPRYVTAPGGAFPARELGCTSCHDPHERNTFRMLNGSGPVQNGVASFTEAAPRGEGIDLDAGSETAANHSAYVQGMSRWCGNCHGRYHERGISSFEHPVDETLEPEVRDQYNRYNGEADPTGGDQFLAYLPEVPFEDLSAAVDSRTGPTLSSRIMCLSCHRAHATSAQAALRWDPNVTLLADDGAVSGSFAIPDPYSDPDQGTLCRKCHEVVPSLDGGTDAGSGAIPSGIP